MNMTEFYFMTQNVIKQKNSHRLIFNLGMIWTYTTANCRNVALRKNSIERPENYSATHNKNCIFIVKKKLGTVGILQLEFIPLISFILGV